MRYPIVYDEWSWAREQRDEWLHARDVDEHRPQPARTADQQQPWETPDPEQAEP